VTPAPGPGHLTDVMVVCAWCNRQIAPRPARPEKAHQHSAVSHGMCPTCLQERIGQIKRAA
jgi:hypothetical protein